jgi:hypothetical protein
MRIIMVYMLCFGVISSCAQSKKVLNITLSDDSIFENFRRNFSDFPQNYFVYGKFRKWDARRFWLEEIQHLSADSIKRLESDEHHPYNFVYLFSDTTLNQLFSNSEKRNLSEKAYASKEKKISIQGINFKIVNDINRIKGYYFEASEPIFTSNGLFAFIDLYIFHNDSLITNGTPDQHLLGRICVVYQKQTNGVWKQLKVSSLLTL